MKLLMSAFSLVSLATTALSLAVSPMSPPGRLFVQASDGSYNGYVSSMVDAKGRYVVDPNPKKALIVNYVDHRLVPFGYQGEGPIMGATFGEGYKAPPGNNAFEGNVLNYAMICATSNTPYKAPANPEAKSSCLPKDGRGTEAAIFYLDPQNNEILPTWINPDGTPRLSTFGMPKEGLFHPLVISMNIGSYNAVNGGYSARVFLEPINFI
ncbi:hypothetical protein CPB86DRAFT_748284 [Serendipita vermifera]|nr:hypothetical protein CPB86DRAFT_748284 [Serendipita vermifera]